MVERAEDAAVAAKPLGGTALVDARSYLVQDAGTNAPILGLNVAGQRRAPTSTGPSRRRG